MANKSISGHIAALITVMVWGLTFTSTKVLLQVFSPVEILFIRFTVGYFALWCVFPRRLILTDKSQEKYFIGAGLCGVTLYYLLENIALTYTFASNVGVIMSVTPFFTVIFSCLFLRQDKPNARFFSGFIIAMTGIVLISFGNGASLEINPFGDVLALIATITWAAYSIITKKISEFGYSTIQTTRRTFFYGLMFMIPAMFIMDFQVKPQDFLSFKIILNLLFLGVGASALCFVTWNLAVKILGSVKTSVYIYAVPVINTITASIILDEKITLMMICGIFLTLIGLFLSEDRKGA